MHVIFIWAVFLYEIVTFAIYFSYYLVFLSYKFSIFIIVIRRVRKIANKRLLASSCPSARVLVSLD
jgi:hypothetical protein